MLASFGATDVVLCVGYGGETIAERIGESCAGIRIAYSGVGGERATRPTLSAHGRRRANAL
jgi:NDP-sugar pyrophosphorylase family protein